LSLLLVPLFAPLPLLIAAAISFLNPGRRPKWVLGGAEIAALFALLIAFGGVIVLVLQGPGVSGLIGTGGVGFSCLLDAVSVTMLLLVSFIGWIVVRYARTYLDGEARHGAFTGWLCMTLAAVLFLVQAGNLVQLAAAWIGMSVALRRLLLFYPERLAAQRAERKKRLFSQAGAVALIAAAGLIALAYGTTDIATINAAARAGDAPVLTLVAASLLAFAALLKSAQFPTHGWLTEVMEAPTPVSALLHAGVVNAGGFLLVRFADLMLTAPGVLAAVTIVGGFTALFGALVMLTQPAVKTSLAWSTVAQMGFMMLECGLALFSLALLHIVVHSFYKAHAFLASGCAVEQVASIRRPGPVATPNGAAVGRAFALALAIYAIIGAIFGLAFGFDHKSPQSLALGAILIFGVAYLLAQGLADAAPRVLTRKTASYAVVAAIGYFTLQTAAEWLTRATLPEVPAPGRLEWTLMVLATLSFGAVAIAQALLPLWSNHPAATGLRVHFANGLYLNAVLNRMLGGWSVRHDAVTDKP
jgi:NADH:ubiquinone oxidoreductase subunit 5 (subunit L)/multisubunit Na+/H+ antiporter MnhA subunit